MAAASWAQTPPPKAPAKKTTTTPQKRPVASKSGVTKRPVAAAPSTAKPTTARTTTGKTPVHTASARRPAPRTTWRNRQAAPTPERYKEIQEALAAKGYMRAEDASGAWGDASSDALKRFQADQNLESTGKINSLSLIALGLGPKHDNAPPPKPPAPAQEVPSAR
jgi:hypothetical protein